MYAFRRQPLTWLFLIATACLDLAAVAADFQVVWFDYLVAGQLFVAGGWLAIGGASRLARAAVALAAVALLTAPDYLMPSRYGVDVWRYVLATLMYLTVACAIACWCWMAILRLLHVQRPSADRVRWQFPLIELFGWNIVVAVVLLMLRSARFTHLDDQSSHYLILGAGAAIAALMIISFVWREPRNDLQSLLFVATAIVIYWVALAAMYPKGDRYILWDAFAYVAAWILVRRVDALGAGELHAALSGSDAPAAAASTLK